MMMRCDIIIIIHRYYRKSRKTSVRLRYDKDNKKEVRIIISRGLVQGAPRPGPPYCCRTTREQKKSYLVTASRREEKGREVVVEGPSDWLGY